MNNLIAITTSLLSSRSQVLPRDLWPLQGTCKGGRRRRQTAAEGSRGRVSRGATYRADFQRLLDSRWYGRGSGNVISRSSETVLVCHVSDGDGLTVWRFVGVSTVDHGRRLVGAGILDVPLFLLGDLVFGLVAKIRKDPVLVWSKSGWDLLESVASIAGVFVVVSQDGDWDSGGVRSGRSAVQSGRHGSGRWGGVGRGNTFTHSCFVSL